MTQPAPTPPAAVTAFLRGLDRRARLLARVQAGDADAARQALAITAKVFAADAGHWPLAQWPGQYWRLLLSVPAMRKTAGTSPQQVLPGIARLAPAPRAAVLLHLVAALEDADAAAALGIDVDAYQQRIRDALPRDALDQPDLDVWRAWRAAARRELDAAQAADPAPAAAVPAPPAQAAGHRHYRKLRWLWLGVAACALALLASLFLHPGGRTLLDNLRARIRSEPLPAAEAPKARFEADAPHPDAALLAAPEELQLASQLSLLAWLSATAETTLATTEPAAMPAADATAGADLATRQRRWDLLPAARRAAQRQAWAEWQALPAGERALLRATAARLAALPAVQRQALQAQHAQLPFDERQGWLLGPQLGRSWPRIAALFSLTAAGEREALLQLLRSATADDLDALARLAQTTPPEARAALRRDLLAQPQAQRTAWLQAQLNR